jgi:hypothetical protein
VALRLVDRGHRPALEQLRRDAGHVQRQEVRHQPHHRSLAALGQLDLAFDVDQPTQALGAGVPEQRAFDGAAAEPAEMLAQQHAALFGIQLGQAQLHVARRDAPPLSRHGVEHMAERAAQRRLQPQRQPMQQPQHGQQRVGGPGLHEASGAGATASTLRGSL